MPAMFEVQLWVCYGILTEVLIEYCYRHGKKNPKISFKKFTSFYVLLILGVIMKITKSAGSFLKPHLSILIPALLEATSELEGTEIGYLSSRLANDPGVQEKLDLARISAAKSSPMMECVNFVIQYVDASSLMGLVPR